MGQGKYRGCNDSSTLSDKIIESNSDDNEEDEEKPSIPRRNLKGGGIPRILPTDEYGDRVLPPPDNVFSNGSGFHAPERAEVFRSFMNYWYSEYPYYTPPSI